MCLDCPTGSEGAQIGRIKQRVTHRRHSTTQALVYCPISVTASLRVLMTVSTSGIAVSENGASVVRSPLFNQRRDNALPLGSLIQILF